MYFLLEKKDGCGYIHPYTWEEEKEDLIDPEAIHSCLVEKKDHDLLVQMQVPLQEEKKVEGKKQTVPLLGQGHAFSKFAFVVWEDGICFADFDGYLQGIMDRLRKENGKKTPEAMLYRLFQILVENDIHVLDVIYKQLATLEEEIPKDNARFFLQKMYTMKHSIYQLFRYYQQLTELADDLMEWEGGFLDPGEMECFSRVITRTKRLADDMEIMREYAMEIWEIYQSQISIRQNDIMKILTIVTTIFLPLSLLAGWYGMNFEYMPELHWRYGYVGVLVAAVLIVIFSMILFRRKRYW